MDNNLLTLFCLVDGEATTNAFPVEAESTKTIGNLKELIKTKKTNDFQDVDADKLTLWRVSIPDDDDNELPVLLDTMPEKKKLKATAKLSKVFDTELPDDTIHVIVQRPPQVHAPVPSRALTPLPGYLSDGSRPGTPLSGDLHADIKRITDKFFAPGPIVNFLDAGATCYIRIHSWFAKGVASGFGKAPETRPSLLFMDLPDPSTPDSASRNHAAGSILELVKENNRYHIPVFGVSGCGKTRAVIELLSQHWGFYFNASSDDWGSSDMMTLHSTVQKHLNDTRDSPTADRQYCLGVPGCAETFTSARWTLLQVCPHVLFDDLFNELFRKLRRLVDHREGNLSDYVSDAFEDVKGRLVGRGCLPKIKDDTRLLIINDEAQFLGDQLNGSFQSMSSSDESPRPLLSPILHAFRDIGQHQLTLVTCGTGLSINTLFWVQSSGSGLKDSSTDFEFLEFPGWTDLESIKAYVSRVRRCLLNDESRRIFDERLPQDALDMLFDKFVGRYRPAIVAVEKIVEHSERGTWKALIEDTEDKLIAWEHRTTKGNLCRELDRLDQKHKDARNDKSEKTVLDILGFYFYRRCFRGEHTLEDDSVNASLVERAFGRIKIINHNAVTVVDEPFVFKAVENYFTATDPGFQTALKELMYRTDAAAQGNIFERYMIGK
ncbi:hypothetical protein BGZ95_006634 [Linnemannia exigua]|uniref:Crinkler effector protein N-terminal domain-containing protein n=1 Tax=Linnemannia exigua TaxID=604196 RepID=A0AAD4H9C6_9FUNG|nr:hypothetical protein BGZ95_006634 [Linnemannia exigua]